MQLLSLYFFNYKKVIPPQVVWKRLEIPTKNKSQSFQSHSHARARAQPLNRKANEQDADK